MDDRFSLPDLSPLAPIHEPGVRVLYGTVAALSPFSVLVDGDDDPVRAVRCVAAGVGDRVVMLLTRRVLTAIAVLTADQWHIIGSPGETAFAAGWSTYAAGSYSDVSFRREGASVRLRGLIANRSASAPSTMFTLPPGFRPAQNKTVIAMGYGTGATYYLLVRLLINSTGDVVYQWGGQGNTTINGPVSWISLDGLTFEL